MYFTNIEMLHPDTEPIHGGFIGAARSLFPGLVSAIGRAKEETFMKFAKGIEGLLGKQQRKVNNNKAYQCYCHAIFERTKLLEKMLGISSIIDDLDILKGRKRLDLNPHSIKNSK